MVKKNGFNIMLFVIITVLLMIISCAKFSKDVSAGVLLQTDRDFSEMSVNEGMFKAFLSYIDDNGVILRNKSYPAKGKEALKDYYSEKTDTGFILRWEPLYEKISGNGDLGYTYGLHTTTDRSTGETSSGTYVTIWQRQPDGSWKFVLDTGTQGLPQ